MWYVYRSLRFTILYHAITVSPSLTTIAHYYDLTRGPTSMYSTRSRHTIRWRVPRVIRYHMAHINNTAPRSYVLSTRYIIHYTYMYDRHNSKDIDISFSMFIFSFNCFSLGRIQGGVQGSKDPPWSPERGSWTPLPKWRKQHLLSSVLFNST